jgi:hypothetical protein
MSFLVKRQGLQPYDESFWLGLHEERHAALGVGVSFGLQGAEEEPEVARC